MAALIEQSAAADYKPSEKSGIAPATNFFGDMNIILILIVRGGRVVGLAPGILLRS